MYRWPLLTEAVATHRFSNDLYGKYWTIKENPSMPKRVSRTTSRIGHILCVPEVGPVGKWETPGVTITGRHGTANGNYRVAFRRRALNQRRSYISVGGPSIGGNQPSSGARRYGIANFFLANYTHLTTNSFTNTNYHGLQNVTVWSLRFSDCGACRSLHPSVLLSISTLIIFRLQNLVSTG